MKFNDDDAVAPGERQRGIEHRPRPPSNTVAPTAMATAIANAPDQRQPSILDQHPHAESGVLPDRVQPPQRDLPHA